MQFEINGQSYFLTFVEDERKWYVFVPNSKAVERIAVYVDAPASEKQGILGNGSFNTPR